MNVRSVDKCELGEHAAPIIGELKQLKDAWLQNKIQSELSLKQVIELLQHLAQQKEWIRMEMELLKRERTEVQNDKEELRRSKLRFEEEKDQFLISCSHKCSVCPRTSIRPYSGDGYNGTCVALVQ